MAVDGRARTLVVEVDALDGGQDLDAGRSRRLPQQQ